MKVLLITFDKEMEKKIRELLKEHQVISAKNGEEALLLDTADVDIVIYDALAGGLAEEDINKLYEEAFKDKPFLILMDDLFPIEPSNVKPKVKKIVSREVDVDKIPQLVNELVSKAGTGATQEEQPAAPAQAAPPPAEEEKKEEAPAAEESWESLFGTNVVQPRKKEEKPVQAEESSTTLQPAEVSPQPPQEEKQKPETPSEGQITLTPPTEQKQPSQPSQEAKTAESKAEEKPLPESPPTKKQCLLVSFDIPLVEKIDQLIGDLCDLYTARSAKQALQKYGDKDFDIIIFDTISGVFAEKGIKDLYEKGGYKDALYVVLLDEFMPIDIDRLPVKNLRAIKRESEIDMLPEIIESAPHITLEKYLAQAGGALAGETGQTQTETPAATSTETAGGETGLEDLLKELETVGEQTTEPQTAETTAQPAAEVAKEETPTEATPAEAITAQPSETEAKEEEKVISKEEQPPAVETKPQETLAPTETKPAQTAPSQAAVSPPQAARPAAAAAPAYIQLPEEKIEKIVERIVAAKVLPLIEELIKQKLSDAYIRGIVEELLKQEVDKDTIREIIRETAEPIVRRVLDELLLQE